MEKSYIRVMVGAMDRADPSYWGVEWSAILKLAADGIRLPAPSRQAFTDHREIRSVNPMPLERSRFAADAFACVVSAAVVCG